MTSSLLLLLVLPLLGGCGDLTDLSTTLDVDLPEHEPQLTVNSLFSTRDTAWVVRLSRSVGMETNRYPPEVTDATVVLFQGGEPLDTLRHVPPDSLVPHPQRHPAFYLSRSGLAPQPNRSYAIQATAPDLPPVQASSHTPAAPSLRIVDTAFCQPEHELTLRLSDPGGEKNYYELTVLGPPEHPSSGPPFRPVVGFSSRDPLFREGSDLEGSFDDGEVFYSRALFSDQSIDGQTREVLIRQRRHSSNQEFLVVLLALTEASYRYKRTRDQHESTAENPFAEPVPVYNNVEGGYGIFAGATATTRSYVPPSCDPVSQEIR